MDPEFNRSVGAMIAERQDLIAESITRRHYELRPELLERYGERGRHKCLQDANYHLSYLAESLQASARSLFGDYVAWARVMLAGRGIPESDLADNLIVMRDCLQKHLPAAEGTLAGAYVDAGLEQVGLNTIDEGGVDHTVEDPLSDLARGYLDALLGGRRAEASRMVIDAVESGVGVRDVYLQVFQRAQHEVGRLWQENRLSVAQEHYCTAATQMIMSQLYPYIFTTEKNGRTMVAASVSGDLHEIGVRMVSDFFEMEGWDTFYLGANTPTPDILKMIEQQQRRVDLLVISATMTFHIGAVRELIRRVRASRVASGVKIMVGGYPFNIAPELWREVGADAYSRNALEALSVAERLMNEAADE